MISIKYEIYYNDYNRKYEDKSFGSMAEFKDWLFGLMNRPYVDKDGYKNMYFLDNNKEISSGSRIEVRPERGGASYWIHCVSDNNNIVFSNGKYTNGQCYISEGFKEFMKECQDKRDGKEQSFVFGEINGFVPVEVKSYAEQAADFIMANPLVAREISTLLDKQYHREDVVSKLEERGLSGFSDKEIDDIVDDFENCLSKNDSYYEAFWASVDYAIDEFVKEKGPQEKVAIPPSLDELRREYEHFIEITKDIRTVEQAKEFQEKNHIPVEINGVSINEYLSEGGSYNEGKTDENIEWIRYEYCDHLWYLYDRFDGKPVFDVYYGPYGDDCLVENICIDTLTPENYSKWLGTEISELVSKELNRNNEFGYTMPDGKHHIYIYADFLDEDKVFVAEPNRVVDGAHEPFVGDTYIGPWENFDELCKGIEWCLEQFNNDKELSLEEKLAEAVSKSQESDTGKTIDIEMEKE